MNEAENLMKSKRRYNLISVIIVLLSLYLPAILYLLINHLTNWSSLYITIGICAICWFALPSVIWGVCLLVTKKKAKSANN